MAVTLEPCSHQGRTGPCADALLEAGIRDVYVGHRDPHPEVSGRGLRRLRAGGARVRAGVLEAECRELHRGFLCLVECGRPHVALKLAATLDGRIALASGESRWITGEAARARVHRLRARVDAVLVGSATARADDPALTARRGERVVHRPLRVVVDSKLSVSSRLAMFRGPDPERSWVLAAPRAPAARRKALLAAGARVLSTPRRGRHLDLPRALQRLGTEGITSVLVEGGAGLAAALLRAGLVDELHWFIAPKLIGGDGRRAVEGLGLRRLSEALHIEEPLVSRLGPDLYIRGQVFRAEPR